jgi:dihydrofolate synthase/folylpolyglutamate synthase
VSTPDDQQAVRWLHSFADSERALPQTPAEFNLPRTRALLALLGNPQTRYPSVIIAGTKGKGSTAAMVEAILRASGRRVGLYTSPHLHSFHERIQVNRHLITPSEITAQVSALRPLVAQIDPALGALSIYEVQTALALAHFAAAQVELAVLEIGLGGRYDAVNTVTPTVAAISSISLDHTHILGATVGEIAWHKAGIIRPGVPVVTVPQSPEAATALAQVALTQNTPLWIADTQELRQQGVSGPSRPYPVPVRADTVGLPGLFQLENARLASGIVLLLNDMGWPTDAAAVATGLATVRWPGRLETLRERPRLIVDGAHNGDSAQKLMASLQALVPYRRLILILATSADKDLSAIAAALVPPAQLVIVTQTPHPRAAAPSVLLATVQPYACGETLMVATVAEAVAAASSYANPDDLICATGSLFLVAAVREVCG